MRLHMSRDPRISFEHRLAAVLVVLAWILLAFASVSTRFHSHPGHSHSHLCSHHHPPIDGNADPGRPAGSTADGPDKSCGLCLFQAGCPAPETIVLPDLSFPRVIAWIRFGPQQPAWLAGALRPPERGPPSRA